MLSIILLLYVHRYVLHLWGPLINHASNESGIVFFPLYVYLCLQFDVCLFIGETVESIKSMRLLIHYDPAIKYHRGNKWFLSSPDKFLGR